jgi:hypothetical protein
MAEQASVKDMIWSKKSRDDYPRERAERIREEVISHATPFSYLAVDCEGT